MITIHQCSHLRPMTLLGPKEVHVAEGNNQNKDLSLLLNHWISLRLLPPSLMVSNTKEYHRYHFILVREQVIHIQTQSL